MVGLQYTPMGRADQRPDETPVPPEIQELVAQGNAKEAVKRYRELTGASMQQAQAAIESPDQSPGTCRATKPFGYASYGCQRGPEPRASPTVSQRRPAITA